MFKVGSCLLANLYILHACCGEYVDSKLVPRALAFIRCVIDASNWFDLVDV